MGLKGYRLWVMGQLDSNVQSPTAMSSAVTRDPSEYFFELPQSTVASRHKL
jgi:hypothetical protein